MTITLALSPEERADLERQIWEELEAERQRRSDNVRRRSSAQGSGEDRPERRNAEVYELREQAKQRFYQEHHYKLYVDSTGREVWLPPEEYEQRMARRRRRKEPPIPLDGPPKTQLWLIYAGLAVVAVLMGLLLAR
jgi:hypothetical protein